MGENAERAVPSEAMLADWIRQAIKLDKLMHNYPVYQTPASVVSQVQDFVHEIAWTRLPANATGERPD